AQQLAHRPRLERAAVGSVRRLRVGDLAHVAESRPRPVRAQGLEEALARLRARRPRVAVDAQPGLDEGPDQPRPHRALVVRRVAAGTPARRAPRAPRHRAPPPPRPAAPAPSYPAHAPAPAPPPSAPAQTRTVRPVTPARAAHAAATTAPVSWGAGPSRRARLR